MAAKESWVVPSRAEALAKLLLTERDDLDIFNPLPSNAEKRFDLLVRVRDDRDERPAEFGVQVRGARAVFPSNPVPLPLVIENASQALRGDTASPGIPLCLFVFDVDAKQGLYRWIVEPVVEQHDRLAPTARLVPVVSSVHASPSSPHQSVPWSNGSLEGYRRLNGDALDDIVNKVKCWHEARTHVLAS